MMETLIDRLLSMLTKALCSLVAIGKYLHTVVHIGGETSKSVAAFPDINNEIATHVTQ